MKNSFKPFAQIVALCLGMVGVLANNIPMVIYSALLFYASSKAPDEVD